MKEKKQNTCHSQVSLLGISTLYPSPLAAEVCGGLYPSPLAGEGRVRGFTLLEILVAVLIIGILVAVAVPQYQKAVLKSRFSSLMPLGKALHDGNESYYLEHGSYTNDPTKLDVRANNSNAQITLGNEKLHKYVLLTRNDMHNKLVMYQKNSEFFPNEIHCEALKTDAQANWLCEGGLKGTLLTERALSDGYNTYLLQGTGNGGFPKTWIDVSDQELERGDSCTTSYNTSGCNNVTITDGNCTPGNLSSGSCVNSTFNHANCSGGLANCYSSTFTNGSVCTGTDWKGCSESSVFIDSECYGKGGNTCQTGSFTDSTCYGTGGHSCHGGTFNNSVCYGNNGTATFGSCSAGTFQNGSVCYAQATKSCQYNTYKDTSYCAGSFCPNNAPSGTAGKKWYRGTGEDWPDDRPSELVNK